MADIGENGQAALVLDEQDETCEFIGRIIVHSFQGAEWNKGDR